MKKIEAIVRPERLDKVKEALSRYDVRGLTLTQVMGCGHQKGRKEIFRGTEMTVNLIQKVKLEVVIPDEELEKVIQIISESARTGAVGDGKIFVQDIADAIRIRTGDRGIKALK